VLDGVSRKNGKVTFQIWGLDKGGRSTHQEPLEGRKRAKMTLIFLHEVAAMGWVPAKGRRCPESEENSTE